MDRRYRWKLLEYRHVERPSAGENSLEVTPVNDLGRAGATSTVRIYVS